MKERKNQMKNEAPPPPCRATASTKRFFVILLCVAGAGVLLGISAISFSKAARLADDIHDVKEDYDKVKGKVAEDYKVVSEKATEAVKEVNAKELGEGFTEGSKEVGRAFKDRAIRALNSDTAPVDSSKPPKKTLKQRLLEKLREKKE
jgi:hypothetical protein